MHELTVATHLVRFLERLSREKGATAVLNVSLSVNPLSCLDTGSLSFTFRALTRGHPLLRNTRIRVTRRDDPISREIVVDNVEIECDDARQENRRQ